MAGALVSWSLIAPSGSVVGAAELGESDPPKPVPHVALLPGGKKIVAPAPPNRKQQPQKSNVAGELNRDPAPQALELTPAALAPAEVKLELSSPSETPVLENPLERTESADSSPKGENLRSLRTIARAPEYTRRLESAKKSAATNAVSTTSTGKSSAIDTKTEVEPKTADTATPAETPQLDPLKRSTPSTPRVMTPQLLSLQHKVRKVLTSYFPRRLNAREHDCWEVMHAVIAYGLETDIHRDGPSGKLVNGAGWLCFNGACQNYRMLYVEDGRVMAKQGVGVQGHFGQFLAILAQSQMPLNYPMQVEGQEFTVGDLLESEKVTCQTGMELTFKLIAIAKYSEDLNETWQNKWGEQWSVERLVKEELAAPIRGAACGGTHRLTGLAHAVRFREQLEQPIDGEFQRAKKFLEDYHRYTYSLQNRDGSFSTEWFRGPGARPDLGRRLQTTGHILEWLVFSLPERELTDPRVIKAVDYLSTIMLANPDRDWEIGPLGHAIHALALYNERVFQVIEHEQREFARERLSDRSESVRRAGVRVDPATGDAVEE